MHLVLINLMLELLLFTEKSVYIVSNSSSIQNEIVPPYTTFEQGLNLRVALSLDAYQHEPDDSVRSLFDDTADVNSCANSGFSPSRSSSMSGHDTASLKQRNRRTSVNQKRIQSISHCMW